MASTWKVTVHLFDVDDPRSDTAVTNAHAVLTTSSGTTVDGHGQARRAPRDVDVPEIGEEIAAARALREIADRLLEASEIDLADVARVVSAPNGDIPSGSTITVAAQPPSI